MLNSGWQICRNHMSSSVSLDVYYIAEKAQAD